jgi:hypothetical protein
MDERTEKRRFRIELPLTMSWDFDQERRTVSGTVVEIGSDGLLFLSEAGIPSLALATVSIAWPVPLDDGCRLQLIVMGPMINAGPQGYRMRIEQYVFRTAARSSGAVPMAPPDLVVGAPQRNRAV